MICLPETKKLTCIVCPIGCQIQVILGDNEIIEINGFTCPRGKEYAVHEITNPLRMVTSTVRVMGGCLPLLPVKTSKPIPKHLIMECMKEINKACVKAPVGIGDVIVSDIFGSGVDIIATRDIARDGDITGYRL